MAKRIRKPRFRDSRFRFFWRFFESKKGRILGLATEREHIRDGLALSHVARFFPWPEYDHITIEPVRKTIRAGTHTIVVGWSSLFYDPRVKPHSGIRPPVPDDERLKNRLKDMVESGSLRIVGSSNRRIENVVTGQIFRPTPRAGETKKAKKTTTLRRDFGVIRRQFRDVSDIVIVMEGAGRLGTLGTVKVAMDLSYLDEFFRAIDQLDGFKDSNQLEILVETTVPAEPGELYTLEDVDAEPLLMVYNRRWVFPLKHGADEWVDQMPWDVQLGVDRKGGPVHVTNEQIERIPVRVEFRADLSRGDDSLKALCRKVLSADRNRQASVAQNRADASRLIDALSKASEDFDIKVWCEADKGAEIICYTVPSGQGVGARRRKRFLIHLALHRLWRRQFRVTGTSVRKLLPKFRPQLSGDKLVDDFMVDISGKLRQSFVNLLGTAAEKKSLVRVESTQNPRTYSLRLLQAGLVIRLRL